MRYGIATLEAAERVGARAVVLHLGRVPVEQELLAEYRRLESAEGPPTPELLAAVAAVLAARERLREPHLDAVLRSVDRLNREALRRGLLLGIENRFHPHEIPLHDEVGLILREFDGGAVRYWHDVGHALNHQRLGIGTQEAWLEAYGTRLAGAHLHDIRGGRGPPRAGDGRGRLRGDPAPPAGGRDQDPGDPPERPARGAAGRAGPAARAGVLIATARSAVARLFPLRVVAGIFRGRSPAGRIEHGGAGWAGKSRSGRRPIPSWCGSSSSSSRWRC